MQQNSQLPTPGPLKICVGVNEATAALGLGRTRVYELIAEGKLKSFHIGGRRLFKVSELQDFVREAANAG